MDKLSRLKMIAENNGGIINNKIAAEHGISRAILGQSGNRQSYTRGGYDSCESHPPLKIFHKKKKDG